MANLRPDTIDLPSASLILIDWYCARRSYSASVSSSPAPISVPLGTAADWRGPGVGREEGVFLTFEIASARIFWLTPHRFGMFFSHFLWQFTPHSARKDTKEHENNLE